MSGSVRNTWVTRFEWLLSSLTRSEVNYLSVVDMLNRWRDSSVHVSHRENSRALAADLSGVMLVSFILRPDCAMAHIPIDRMQISNESPSTLTTSVAELGVPPCEPYSQCSHMARAHGFHLPAVMHG